MARFNGRRRANPILVAWCLGRKLGDDPQTTIDVGLLPSSDARGRRALGVRIGMLQLRGC